MKRLLAWLVKTPVKILLLLVVAWFLFAWLGFEPLLKWAAPKYLADKSRHVLSLQSAKFDPLRLSIDLRGVKLAEPNGQNLLEFEQFFVDFSAASLSNWAWTFDALRLRAPVARLELRADGSLNWSALIEALKGEEEEEDNPLPRVLLHRVVLEKGRLDFVDRKVAGGFATTLHPLDLTLTDLSTLPNDRDAYAFAATTQTGARIRGKGGLMLNPFSARGDIGIDKVTLARFWPYVGSRLNMAPPAGSAEASLHYDIGYADKRLSLRLDKIDCKLQGLGLRGKRADRDALTLERLALTGGRFDLETRQFDIGEIALGGGRVAVRRDVFGRLDVLDWFAQPATPVMPADAASGGAPVASEAAEQAPWRINLKRFALDGLGIEFEDAGFAKPLLANIANLQLGFAAHAEVGGAQTQARIGDLGLALSGIRLAAAQTPLFVLGGIGLEAGKFDLAARSASAGKLSLVNGKLEVLRDAQGRIALLDAFEPAPGQPHTDPKTAVGAATARTQAAPDWRYTLEEIGLSGFELGLRDETVQPAGTLTLQGIEASARGFSENLRAALPVKLAFRVKEGGRLQANGKVIPALANADIKLKLDGLVLSPAQPWLSQAAHLSLASGRASTQGRIRYAGQAVAENRLDFAGSFSVEDLLLKESVSGERFLAWKRLGSDTLKASPAGLDIAELKLDGLGAKLVIYADKTVNLKKILRTASTAPAEGAKTGEAAQAAGGETIPPLASPTPPPAGKAEPGFRVAIDRVRVEAGEVDFADLSLALPFGTRIHDFKGALNGISSQPGAVAELELDGHVDEYGLARVVGQIDLFDPTGFMDIKTVFRNVEMANLTPYTATFAGYKIASGKLSLDLEYKIKQRQLLGENQIIMDKLILGERLEGPQIKHLPLELAIAILRDADGRIDLGLPVSGSLDDPQFSYGRIIWKAIGNLLSKIVTAPFRALASLFGGNGEKLEQLVFEAGEPELTPPEREKFKQIAQILGKRPGLALTVHAAWSAEIDRPVLRERQLRRAVVEKMGVKLAADEDAGPISTANPKARAALEALYAQRIGAENWKTLYDKWSRANPDKQQTSGAGKMLSRLKGLFKTEEPLSASDLELLQGKDLHALLYARLLDLEVVSDTDLRELAQRRARAVLAGLAAVGAPAERIHAAEIAAYSGEGRDVPAKLELGVAEKRSPNAPGAEAKAL